MIEHLITILKIIQTASYIIKNGSNSKKNRDLSLFVKTLPYGDSLKSTIHQTTQNQFLVIECETALLVIIDHSNLMEIDDIIDNIHSRGSVTLPYHYGYYKRAMEINHTLRAKYSALTNPAVFAGFSMGGAIAQICANEWSDEQGYSYSFGSPKVLKRKPKKNNQRSLILNLEEDSVQYVNSFFYTNRPYLLGKTGCQLYKNTWRRKIQRAFSWTLLFFEWFPLFPTKYHDINLYVYRLYSLPSPS